MEKLSREDEAKRDLEHTQIARGTSWLLALAFIATLLSVPLIQRLHEWRTKSTVEFDRTPSDNPASLLPSRERIAQTRTARDAIDLAPTAAQLRDWENRLEDESVVAQRALPLVQTLLLRGGAGNEQALVGRAGWLHYRPDVEYVSSRGFLDPALQRVRARAGDAADDAVSPDALRAIRAFRDDLQKRGVRLVLLPVPVKTSIHPETLSARFDASGEAIHNRSWPAFLQSLDGANIDYFDATPLLVANKKQGAQFLQTDTHWTPAAMESVARSLAAHIEARETPNRLSPRAGSWNQESQTVANIGDIAELLKLPREQKAYPPQRVQIHPITENGAPFSPRRAGEILLLGDSFSNIYSSRESFPTAQSLEGRGWGANAGLAEQLSFFLRRPLDSLTNNAGGSHVTRARLAGEWRRNPARFRNLKIVVWQFAARDLLSGDWKLIPLAAKRKP